MRARLRPLLASLLIACSLACGKSVPPPAAPVEVAPPPAVEAGPPPLYTRLGGKGGVYEIVESLWSNIQADKRVNKAFAKTTGDRLDHFKQMLADQICELSGGGCQYSGKSMAEAHAGMKITDTQFDAFVQDLTLALQEKQVSADNQKELLDKLAAMHDEVVASKKK